MTYRVAWRGVPFRGWTQISLNGPERDLSRIAPHLPLSGTSPVVRMGEIMKRTVLAATLAALSRIIDQPRMRDITLRVDRRRRGLGAFSNAWADNLVLRKKRDGNPDV